MTRYIVSINAGGARTQSIPLPSKARVRNYVRNNPVGNSRTKVEIYDKKKRIYKIMSKSGGRIWGINFNKRF